MYKLHTGWLHQEHERRGGLAARHAGRLPCGRQPTRRATPFAAGGRGLAGVDGRAWPRQVVLPAPFVRRLQVE